MSFPHLSFPHPPRSRRRRIAAALTLSLLAAAHAAAADTSARQVPGYHHHPLGTLRVTALFDGLVPLKRSVLTDITADALDARLRAQFVPENAQGVQTAVNAYLIDHGDGRLTLVDTGAARCFGPGLGQTSSNLRAAGHRPEQVRDVLLTHAHPDHLCGLLGDDGKPAYPNARVWLARADADFWLEPANADNPGATPKFKSLSAMARAALAPYRAERRLHAFTADSRLPAGITALPAPGHTPGHMAYLVAGGAGEHLLLWGDVVHFHAVQFRQPEAAVEFDFDREQATTSRRALLRRASRERWWVAGAHLPFPGLGHVGIDTQGRYYWAPLEYAPLPGR